MNKICITLLLLLSSLSNAQVGIGTSTPDNSAVLELATTQKGFLPPRMTHTERDAITSPAQGLVVYCTNCGSNGQLQIFDGVEWTNMIGGIRNLVVGESYGGGIVFYILQSNDIGYDPYVCHGLIAASSDQSQGTKWNRFDGQYLQTNASGIAIGTGLSNTNAILSVQGEPSSGYAAGIARVYNGGRFNDWYLPSKDELDKLYQNRALVGGFSTSYYWSSTEAGSSNFWNGAHVQRFSDGYQQTAWRDNPTPFSVRAIRSF